MMSNPHARPQNLDYRRAGQKANLRPIFDEPSRSSLEVGDLNSCSLEEDLHSHHYSRINVVIKLAMCHYDLWANLVEISIRYLARNEDDPDNGLFIPGHLRCTNVLHLYAVCLHS